MVPMVKLHDVQAAAERIRPYVVRTPLERSVGLFDAYGQDVWLKFECFQTTGAFKLRGALNALLARPEAERVITASAGNHGLGLARAAALLGRSATVVVPETASEAKVIALRNSGAELILHGRAYDAAEGEALRLASERGDTYISAYNNPDVVAGGGTVGLEILDALPTTRAVLVPVGGGGLSSGIGVAASAGGVAVYGVQSEASPTFHSALARGEIVTVDVLPSLADGLAGNIERETITFALVRQYLQDVILVTEEQIAEAMRWLIVNERVVVEGAGAVGVAAVLNRRVELNGPIVAVLSGRNVASAVLQQWVHGPVRVPQV